MRLGKTIKIVNCVDKELPHHGQESHAFQLIRLEEINIGLSPREATSHGNISKKRCITSCGDMSLCAHVANKLCSTTEGPTRGDSLCLQIKYFLHGTCDQFGCEDAITVSMVT